MNSSRGENPIGKWTIRVSDQGREDQFGHFIGWSMSLWGSTVDPDKAKPYVLQWSEEAPFPPPEAMHSATLATPTITHPSTTNSYFKPIVTSTDAGISDEPSPSAPSISIDSHPSSSGASSDEWLTDGLGLVSERKWFFGAGGILMITIIGVVIFIWQRYRARRRTGRYAPVPDSDDLRMDSIDRGNEAGVFGRRDEESSDVRHGLLSAGAGIHSGFLEDDEAPPSPVTTPLYRDVPDDDWDRQRDTVHQTF